VRGLGGPGAVLRPAVPTAVPHSPALWLSVVVYMHRWPFAVGLGITTYLIASATAGLTPEDIKASSESPKFCVLISLSHLMN
jgi:hypothetical protein